MKEQKQQQQTVSWRLYDMYSEYTVSERAVATVTDCVVASIRYVYSEYTVSERAVATVTDCVVASTLYVFGVYSQCKSRSNSNRLCRGVYTICIRSIQS